MTIPTNIILYWGGQICHGQFEIDYNGGRTKQITVTANITFQQLLAKIHSAIRIGMQHSVSKLTFRIPMMPQHGNWIFGRLDIWDDDDVQNMFHKFSLFPYLQYIELYVDVVSTIYQLTLSNELFQQQPTFEQPQSSHHAVTSNIEFADDDECADKYEDDDDDDDSDYEDIDDEGYRSDEVESEEEDDNDEWFDDIRVDADDDADLGDDATIDVDMPLYATDHHSPLNPTITPHSHYSNVDLGATQIDFFADVTECGVWDPSKELCTGLLFPSRDAVKAAIQEYSMRNHVRFCSYETRRTTMTLVCPENESGCNWRVRATQKKDSQLWEITRYNGPHSCTNPNLSQDHQQLSSTLISYAIEEILRVDPTVNVKALIQTAKDRFDYVPSYRKAWKAKQKVMARVYGDWDESYNQLPNLFAAIKHFNPGSQCLIIDDDYIINNGRRTDLSKRKFNRCFWTFKPCIDGFEFCRPVIQIDGTFLIGKYKGTLLTASAFDGDNHIFPLAFAIVSCENLENWQWFMMCIRSFVTKKHNLCVISDHHPAIIFTMKGELWKPPLAYHRYCLRHVMSNYNTKFKNTKIKKLLNDAGAFNFINS